MRIFFAGISKLWRELTSSSSRVVPTRRLAFENCEARRVMFAPMDTGEGEAGPLAMPAFVLADVNPASPRFNQAVSPRDYLEQVSAWYFGHST